MFRLTHYAHSFAKEFLDVTASALIARPKWSASLEATEQLRAEMRDLKLSGAAHDAWTEHCKQLQDWVLHRDPSEFLRWKFVRRAMCLTNHLFLKWELDHLQRLPDWSSRWDAALRTPPIGNPVPCLFAPQTVGNTIHLAYHVAQWEQWSGKAIGDIDTLLEFGAGYGGMAHLVRLLGFRGRHILFDLPQFSALQRFYLSSCGIRDGVEMISDISALQETVAYPSVGARMFIANISLSETPMGVRKPIETMVEDWDHFLITYQTRFREIDNKDYFGGWQRPGRQSQQQALPYMPDYWYLFSRKVQ